MPFDFFKKRKKELEYDPTQISILDLRKGWIFDYDLQTWEATEEYEYDWGGGNFTHEFKIVSGNSTAFLHIENDDEVFCTMTTKLNFAALDEKIEERIIGKGRPPKKIKLKGIKYYRDAERPGFFRNIESEDWSEFISWDYYDEDERRTLAIEQWNEREFEASVGLVVPETDFTNILPV